MIHFSKIAVVVFSVTVVFTGTHASAASKLKGKNADPCAPRIEKIKVLATKPTTFTLSANTKVAVGSASSYLWTNDPWASIEAAFADPSQGGYLIKVDKKTMADISDITKPNPGCKHTGACIEGEIFDRVVAKIKKQVEDAIKGKKEAQIIVKCFEYPGDEKWVAAEIWKKYVYRRSEEKGRISKSYIGSCGEKYSNGEPNIASVKDKNSIYLGEYPGAGTLPVAALVATAENQKPVLFCEYGNSIINSGDKPTKVKLQINDDQPADNGPGWIDLTVIYEGAQCVGNK